MCASAHDHHLFHICSLVAIHNSVPGPGSAALRLGWHQIVIRTAAPGSSYFSFSGMPFLHDFILEIVL
jgi:hypothetical protein